MEKINDKVTAIYAQKFKLESFCNGKVDRKKYCILDYELRCRCMLSEIVSVVGSCLTPLKHFPQQLRPETFDKNKFPSQPPSPGPQGYIRDHLTWNIDTVQRFVYFSYRRTVFSCVINITISVYIMYLSLEQTLHNEYCIFTH